MKNRLIAASLLFVTASAVALYPQVRDLSQVAPPAVLPPVNAGTPGPQIHPVAANRPAVDVVFVLDTTGSMGGLIETAKQKIFSIANTMASAQPAPDIRFGIVAYRDRGDAYVTQVVDLSADLDSITAQLMSLQADGGGDTPESVNEALHNAVHRMSWRAGSSTYRSIFLVGDAPPRMDFQDDVKYPVTLAAAKQKGIVVNTIQCGDDAVAQASFVEIASLGSGAHFAVEQAGSAIAVATPFDAELATLARALDDTRLYYGSDEEMAKADAKVAATEKLQATATVDALARRAAFNASESGAANAFGDGDLIAALESGRVELDAVVATALPAELQAVAAPERRAIVAEKKAKREELQEKIAAIAKERDAYLEGEVGRMDAPASSLDQKLYDTVRAQAAGAGLRYEAGPKY